MRKIFALAAALALLLWACGSPALPGESDLSATSGQVHAIAVPNVVGLSYAEAEQKIRDAGFVPKAGEMKASATIEEGKIHSTDPKADTPLAKGQPVTLFIAVYSCPTGWVDMPTLTGWSLDEAEAILKSINLKLDKTDVPEIDSDVAKGKVTWQSVEAKEKVAVGTVIKVKISN